MRLFLALCLTILAAPARADAPRVITDFAVVQSLAAMVMGDLGQPAVLMDQGADPHHFQMRPSQAAALEQADVVFWIGPQMTPWLDHALEGGKAKRQIVPLLQAAGTLPLETAENSADHGKETDHDHEGGDPHAWLDPASASAWIIAMQQALAAADPDNADTYTRNAIAALKHIEQTRSRTAAILAPVGDTPILVFHDAYGYFERAFGLNIIGHISGGDAAAPGAQRLTDLRAQMADQGAVCAFPEAQHDPAYLRVVIENTPVRLGQPLDPEGTALRPGTDLYDALLTGLARTIADCVTAAE